MLAKTVTYNSQNYAGTLGSGLARSHELDTIETCEWLCKTLHVSVPVSAYV